MLRREQGFRCRRGTRWCSVLASRLSLCGVEGNETCCDDRRAQHPGLLYFVWASSVVAGMKPRDFTLHTSGLQGGR